MKRKTLLILSTSILIISCKKFVDPGSPSTQLYKSSVFNSDATATAALLSVYAQLEGSLLIGNLVAYTGLSSDEFSSNSAVNLYSELALNNIVPGANLTDNYWNVGYRLIYQCNSILEGLEHSNGMTQSVKLQVQGEARFLRAWCYFQLVNLYGSVPLVVTTDYNTNSRLSRSPIADVYKLIEEDLGKAFDLVSTEYKNPQNSITSERTRVNKYAVRSLQAKVFLYQGKWSEAGFAASEVISQTNRYGLTSNLNDVFLKNNKEQIWQVQAIINSFNTYTAFLMILDYTPSSIYLDKRHRSLYGIGDKRLYSWIGLYTDGVDSFDFAYKYKANVGAPSITEYTSMIRLAEIYLIRAEARAQTNKLDSSLYDLNAIRIRAGINSLAGLDRQSILDSIAMERRRELFAENASRWFDLKRTGRASIELLPIKGANWTSDDELYPIPIPELMRNNLLVQNPGY